MGIYSTDDTMTRERAIEIIEEHINAIHSLSTPRIVEVLEALVQVRDYDDHYDCDHGYSNFWPNLDKA